MAEQSFLAISRGCHGGIVAAAWQARQARSSALAAGPGAAPAALPTGKAGQISTDLAMWTVCAVARARARNWPGRGYR